MQYTIKQTKISFDREKDGSVVSSLDLPSESHGQVMLDLPWESSLSQISKFHPHVNGCLAMDSACNEECKQMS